MFFEIGFYILAGVLWVLLLLNLIQVAQRVDDREAWVSACYNLVSGLYEPIAYAAAKSLSQEGRETDQVSRWRELGEFVTAVLPKQGKKVRDYVDVVNGVLQREKFPNVELSLDWEKRTASLKFHPWTVLMQDESGAVTGQFSAYNRERALETGEGMVRRNRIIMRSFLLKDPQGKIVEQVKPELAQSVEDSTN